jgi:hypothetical protein
MNFERKKSRCLLVLYSWHTKSQHGDRENCSSSSIIQDQETNVFIQTSELAHIQSVTERCGQTLGTSFTYQNKKKIVHINMCPETFNM